MAYDSKDGKVCYSCLHRLGYFCQFHQKILEPDHIPMLGCEDHREQIRRGKNNVL